MISRIVSLCVVVLFFAQVALGSVYDPPSKRLSYGKISVELSSGWTIGLGQTNMAVAENATSEISITQRATAFLSSNTQISEHAREDGLTVRNEPRTVLLPKVEGLVVVHRLEGLIREPTRHVVRYYIRDGQMTFVVEAKASTAQELQQADELLQGLTFGQSVTADGADEDASPSIKMTVEIGENQFLSFLVPTLEVEPQTSIEARNRRGAFTLSITEGDFFLRKLESILPQLNPDYGFYYHWHVPDERVIIQCVLTPADTNQAVEILDTYRDELRKAGRERVESLQYRTESVSTPEESPVKSHILSVKAPGRDIQINRSGYRPWGIIAVEYDNFALIFRIAHSDSVTDERVARRNAATIKNWTSKIAATLKFVNE